MSQKNNLTVAHPGVKIFDVETPDVDDVRIRKLLTALKILLRGAPVKLDNNEIIVLAWTEDGKLRAPSFVRLRSDKPPGECKI